MSHVSKLLLVVPICAALAASTWANEAEKASADKSSPLGKKLDGFALQDFRGKSHSLDELKDARLVVVAFLGTECPLSKLYGPRLAELAAQYESKGVKFIGVDSNRQDSVTEMAQYAKVHNIAFPLLKDLNNVLADKLGALRNPQVYLLDGERVVRYVGRIDDQYGFQTGSGYAKPKSGHPDLSSAIDELLAGKPVGTPTTEAIGCFCSSLIDRSLAKWLYLGSACQGGIRRSRTTSSIISAQPAASS